jgi:hypothetical protein
MFHNLDKIHLINFDSCLYISRRPLFFNQNIFNWMWFATIF